MSTDDPKEGSSLPEAVPADGAVTVHHPVERSSSIVVWLAALAVGLGVWLATAAAAFHVEPEVEKIALVMGGEIISQSPRTREIAARRELRRVLVAFGGLLGLGMGLAGGWSWRSWRRAMVAGALGGVAGAFAGGLMPSIMFPSSTGIRAAGSGELTDAIVMRLGMWVPLGAVAGLAFGIGRTKPLRWPLILVGASIGAALGTLLHGVLGASRAMLFPLEGTGELIAEAWKTRPLALLLVALSTAAGILATAKPQKDQPREASHSTGAPPSS